MNIGAAVVALFGFGVGLGALWFAWRLVGTAGSEDESVNADDRGAAEAQSPSEHGRNLAGGKERETLANATATSSALGQIGAVLACGGICLLLPAFVNIADLWHLAAAGLATSLLGLAILLATRRRRKRAPASADQPAAKAR